MSPNNEVRRLFSPFCPDFSQNSGSQTTFPRDAVQERGAGKIELIRTLHGILCVPVSEEENLRGMTLEQLEALTGSLQEKVRNRPSSMTIDATDRAGRRDGKDRPGRG